MYIGKEISEEPFKKKVLYDVIGFTWLKRAVQDFASSFGKFMINYINKNLTPLIIRTIPKCYSSHKRRKYLIIKSIAQFRRFKID